MPQVQSSLQYSPYKEASKALAWAASLPFCGFFLNTVPIWVYACLPQLPQQFYNVIDTLQTGKFRVSSSSAIRTVLCSISCKIFYFKHKACVYDTA